MLSVLEFRLLGELYCINSQKIEYVFELEEYSQIEAFCSCVWGIAKYNDDLMILVDTANLYNSNKKLSKELPKSVVVVEDEGGFNYGLVVDEIVGTEDVEEAISGAPLSHEDSVIKHYKAKDKIVNEIDPLPLLEKNGIPSMGHVFLENKEQSGNKESVEYLLFVIDQKLFGVESVYVKEVVEATASSFFYKEPKLFKGGVAIRERVLQIANFEVAKEPQELVVLGHEAKEFCLEVDAILGIESFEKHSVEASSEDQKIAGFINYNQKVVALLNPFYFFEHLQSVKESQKERSSGTLHHDSFLLFRIDNREFCIDMKMLRSVAELESLPKTNATTLSLGEHVDFITTWNHHAVSVCLLDKLLHLTTNKEEAQVIFVQKGEKLVAFCVDSIEDIVMIEPNRVVRTKNAQDSILRGAIALDKRAVAIMNEEFILSIG